MRHDRLDERITVADSCYDGAPGFFDDPGDPSQMSVESSAITTRSGPVSISR